jgi:hypothetical protein
MLIFISGECCGQDFDRDVATELRIACAPNLTHAAFADLGDDGVWSDSRVGGNSFAHVMSSILSLWRIELLHCFLESRIVAYRVEERVRPVQKEPKSDRCFRLFDDRFDRFIVFAEFRQVGR